MKFLCLACDEQMQFRERQEPGDGTFAASFTCPSCGHEVAMLANPAETQLVGALGVKIGGRELDEQPMEFVERRHEPLVTVEARRVIDLGIRVVQTEPQLAGDDDAPGRSPP